MVYFAIATFAADVVMFNVLGDEIYVKIADWTLSDYQPSSYRRTSVQENKYKQSGGGGGSAIIVPTES